MKSFVICSSVIEEREDLCEAQLRTLRARAMVQEGIDSGPGIPADEVFERLKAKYKKLAKPQGSIS